MKSKPDNRVTRIPIRFGVQVFRAVFCVVVAAAPFARAQVQSAPDSALPQRVAALPDSPTLQSQVFSPMTKHQRWQDYERQNFASYGAFFQAFFTGLGDHLGDVPRWDSGMAGLSEHVGSEFARFTIAGTIHSSLAAALRQDTRYFPCACKGGFRRTLHAVGRTIFTYGDNGHLYPDVSGLAGIYGGSMLGTEWYPDKYTATGFGVRQANIAVGVTSAIYVIREFSPEIKRRFQWRRREPALRCSPTRSCAR